MTLASIKNTLRKLSDPKKAKDQSRFFKTGPGEYGAGDIFIGIKVPELRKLSRKHWDISSEETIELLESPIHEYRQLALFIMVIKYNKAKDFEEKEQIYNLYMSNLEHINNWDLVDCSAMYIVGEHLNKKSKSVLIDLAGSKILWERRVAIMATFNFIRRCEFSTTLKLAKILLKDDEDLIHKAVGWMLREIGNRSLSDLKGFLNKYYLKMPRTMLRYAIEKLPEKTRQAYLKSKI